VGADDEPGGIAAILSGLRRGELFALRWKDIDEQARLLTAREAVYDASSQRQRPKREHGGFRSRIRR
jgi:integrase